MKPDVLKTFYETFVMLWEGFKCGADWYLLSLDSGLMEPTNMEETLKTLIWAVEQFNAIHVSFEHLPPRRV